VFESNPKIQQAVRVQHKYTDTLMQNQEVLEVSVRPVDGYVMFHPHIFVLMVLVDDEANVDHIPSVLDDVPVLVQKMASRKLQ
jgi:hypothetical protein